jgi:transmembrane sensor
MKAGKGGGRIAEEAAFWVVTLIEKPDRRTRARFRIWAERSTRHWTEFLIAASIHRAFQGFDAGRQVSVADLLGDATATVVPLRTSASSEGLECAATLDYRERSPCTSPPSTRAVRRFGNMPWKLGIDAAAILLLTVALPLVGQCLQLPTRHEYATGPGELQTIAFEDGSVIHLNEQSALAITRTPRAHTIQLRSGEAFFAIHHDAGRRWYVLLGDTAVEDVGTQFNVRRSAGDSTVSVLEGSIKIGHGPALASPVPSFMVVDAGQEVRISGAQLQLQRRPVAELESQTAWAKGWLTFTGEPLIQVARTLNQHNRRQLVIADPSIAQLPVGGRFLAADLDALLKTLTAALPVRVLPSQGVTESNIVRLGRAEKSPNSAHSSLVPSRPHT